MKNVSVFVFVAHWKLSILCMFPTKEKLDTKSFCFFSSEPALGPLILSSRAWDGSYEAFAVYIHPIHLNESDSTAASIQPADETFTYL